MSLFFQKLCLILCLPLLLFSQKQNIKFEHMAGLSSNTIQCLLQDKTGFIWFGTQDGLNRYDGNKIVVFKHNLNDSASLTDSWINCMVEDGSGYIWIGTDGGGLNNFDPETESFGHWKHDPDNPKSLSNDVIVTLFIDKSGHLWIGTLGGGINLFDFESGVFKNWVNDPEDQNSISGNYVRSIYQDHEDVIWIGTQSTGLNRVLKNKDKLQFKRYPTNQLLVKTDYVSNIIWSIYEDSKNYLWIGTDNGIARFDPQRKQIDHFVHNPFDPLSLSRGGVRGFLQNNQSDLWIVMFPGGLNKFNLDNQEFIQYTSEENNPYSLQNEYALDILKDNSGLIWVATRDGVSWFDANNNIYEYWLGDGKDQRDLIGSGVRSVYEDKQGRVWIGSEGALNEFNLKTRKMTYLKHDPFDRKSIKEDIRIRAICQDKKGYIWFGTEGDGLNRLNPQNGHIENFVPDINDKHSISSRLLRSIYEDKNGFLWIGTQLGGLNRYNPISKQFKNWINNPGDPNSISNDNVQVVYGDKNGILWLGTDNGLNRYDPETDKFQYWTHDPKSHESLSNKKVRSLYEDKSGNFWIGTRGGFNKFDKNRGTFKSYNKNDGLLSDVIFGILEDTQGMLWLSTPEGLSRFNPQDGSFRSIKMPYDFHFDMGASFKNDKGIMYFGGVEGLVAFNPDSIQGNSNKPPVIITTFKKFNKEFKLPKAISRMEELHIPQNESFISFEFAALDFMNPRKNQYAYRLIGFDNNWIYCGNRSFASYTNLDPGKYTFLVKASNNDGVWNEEGASLTIVIVPPFWATWWFRLLFASALFYLVYSFLRLRTKSIADQNVSLEKAVKRKTSEMEELMDQMLRQDKLATIGKLSGSIAHEIRNPLGAIKQSAYFLKQKMPKDSEKVAKHLDFIEKEIENTEKVINDLLEMSRIRKLRKEIVDIPEVIETAIGRCKMANNVDVKFEIGDDANKVIADPHQLVQVFINLISNAIDSMEKGGVLIFNTSLSAKKDFVNISITDNGKGIDVDFINRVFEPLFTTKSWGTGFGLNICKQIIEDSGGSIFIHSQPNVGTTVNVNLPR